MKKSRSQSSGRTGSSSGRKSSTGSRSAGTGSSRKAASSRSTSSNSRSASGGRSASPASGRTSNTRSNSASSRSTTSRSAPGGRSNAKASSNGRAGTSRAASSNGRSSTASRGRTKQTTPREDLQEVLKDGLKDIYYAEKQLVKALKKMSKAATNAELKQAFETHREQTGNQVALLEQAFEALDMRSAGKKCPAMDGLIEESKEHIEEMDKGPALDAALIVGAQKVEHYEIAAYGSLRAFARCLGITECEQVFDEILQEESETDELLTRIAETVNREALSGEEGAAGIRGSRQMVEMGELEEEQM